MGDYSLRSWRWGEDVVSRRSPYHPITHHPSPPFQMGDDLDMMRLGKHVERRHRDQFVA